MAEFACGLADFVTAFRAIDTGGRAWDGKTRGGRLAEREASVRRSLARSSALAETARRTLAAVVE